MISTVEQGLANYHKALMAYVRKSDKLKEQYNNSDVMMWSTDDYNYIMSENNRLNAMEKALGLNKAEQKAAMRKVKAQLAHG